MVQTERFGQLLRRYRLAVGLTQKGLAARAVVSLRTVTNLEGSRVTRSHGATLQSIAEALELTADEWAQLEQRLAGDAVGVPDARATRAVLPSYDTAFVGRDAELAALRAIGTPEVDVALPVGVPILPHGPRLLTLIGAPGYGKTRLAVALANDVAGGYREGARFVDLTGLTDPDGVTRAVARAIGLAAWPGPAPLDPLLAALRQQQRLLVLDGAEQALDLCAAFADTVLRRCPGVQLVVTSREPLQIEGERVWRVAPLALPEATVVVGAGAARRAALPALRASAAVRLFADRAARVAPTFTVGLANAGPLDAICRALGGVPLAIELAAAQVTGLALPELAAQLAALPQEQPLMGVIAWSYRRLTPADRALLGALAPFVGCWPAEAATVCARLARGDAAYAGLRRLTEAGLVRGERHEGALVYRLPRPVRAYLLAQLRAAGDETAAYARHRAWCLELVRGATGDAAHGPADERIAAADDNLCHALIWALVHDSEGGRRLAAALHDYRLAARPGATGWARLLPLLERPPLPIAPGAPDPSCAPA
ncbi:MAG TPA: helix-turn-helix domain-containing protein [Thermomicrobiales bacterium]